MRLRGVTKTRVNNGAAFLQGGFGHNERVPFVNTAVMKSIVLRCVMLTWRKAEEEMMLIKGGNEVAVEEEKVVEF